LFASSSHSIREALIGEIADLWIITTAIGNQFRIPLNDAPASDAATALLDENIIGDLLRQAGHLARAINYYDGPKTPRSFEGWVPLRCSIPAIHRALYQLATRHGLNVDAAIDHKLGRIPKRDAGRFAASYDPITSRTLAAFDDVRRNTRCPFSETARLWGSPDWEKLPMLDNILRILPSFTSFCRAAGHESLDGYVIALGEPSATQGLEGLTRSFARLLKLLVDHDPGTNRCLDGNVERKGWQFCFQGTRLFVSVHSSLYRPDHLRHAKRGTFVMFQPDTSFDRRGIGSRFGKSDRIKADVRAAFRPLDYPAQLIDGRIEARLYLLSNLEPNTEEYLPWWKYLSGRGSSKTC